MLWIAKPWSGVGLLLTVLALIGFIPGPVSSRNLDVDEAASYFGKMAAVEGMRLSPDGQKISMLVRHPEGFPIAVVRDLQTGKGGVILASDPKSNADISRCIWANETRLLCGYFGIWNYRGTWLPSTRLVAVDSDGEDNQVLAQKQQKGNFALFQDEVVDLLPDDPKKIWIEFDEGRGQGVSEVDIYKNRLKTVIRPKETVWLYESFGRGEVRLRLDQDRTWRDWQYRLAGEKRFHRLHRSKPEDLDDIYEPLGFGADPNELLVMDWHEGRRAVFAERLTDDPNAPRARELRFSHDLADAEELVTLGKYRRGVGVAYTTDRTYIDYFDEAVKRAHLAVEDHLGTDMSIRFIDESWDRRFYLVEASSDVDSGAYYRFDTKTNELAMITRTRPWIEERVDLVPMKAITYPAKDGTPIPGYLTVSSAGKTPKPLIVLPHGGPEARDKWGFDFLVQYLAGQGYAVLQANYRGSSGYGKEWLGRGAYNGWETVVSDLDAGVSHLVERGIADPERVCMVGWSFGGYASLITAIERGRRYRCAVAIAPVTDPYKKVEDARGSVSATRFIREFVPTEAEAIRQSSPLRRVEELAIPTLLLHGEQDLNVRVEHSQDFAKAARGADKKVEYVEYEGIDHYFDRTDERVDMLRRVSEFLAEHLAKKPKVASAAK